MKTIFITGFMGAGKTTIGKELGKKLGVTVVDTDHLIEGKSGMPVKEIFRTYGEKHFRELETNILKEIPLVNTIVTTGGGLILSEENRNYMLEKGDLIFLYCDIDELYARLQNDTDRPLIQEKTKGEINELYQSRIPFYEQCSLKINTTRKTLHETAEEIAAWLK